MCDHLRCEKTGQPINPDCHDCLIPADGPSPEMFKEMLTHKRKGLKLAHSPSKLFSLQTKEYKDQPFTAKELDEICNTRYGDDNCGGDSE